MLILFLRLSVKVNDKVKLNWLATGHHFKELATCYLYVHVYEFYMFQFYNITII